MDAKIPTGGDQRGAYARLGKAEHPEGKGSQRGFSLALGLKHAARRDNSAKRAARLCWRFSSNVRFASAASCRKVSGNFSWQT